MEAKTNEYICDCHCEHEHHHEHNHEHHHDEDAVNDSCGCGCHHDEAEEGPRAFFWPAVSLLMLLAGILMKHFDVLPFADSVVYELIWYLAAFLPVGLPVIKEAFEGMTHRDFFNEFTLMSIASIGAFCIGEFPEAVGVMLFYSVGETLQDRAVGKAKKNIARLLDVRGEKARVIKDGEVTVVDPKTVAVGETIEVRPGERVPLDGILLSEYGTFDTSALTGESVPQTAEKGREVLAGMICSDTTVKLKVSKPFSQSALSRIIEMVSRAASRKAQPELFIRRFARIYTPIVMAMALLLVLVPWIIGIFSPAFNYVFSEWLYRALVFLVISCPCALVVSVPLGYFAGVGAASKAGILFKGGSYLDTITKVDTIAFDKTGTLTSGVFEVERLESATLADLRLLSLMASAELHSSHPLARTLVDYSRRKGAEIQTPDSMQELAGLGAKAIVDDHQVIAGNLKLLDKEKIEYPAALKEEVNSIIACAVDGVFAGFVTLSDTVKPDAKAAVTALRKMGVDNIVMLSGDKKNIVAKVADSIGIPEAHGEMLPEDKARYVEEISNVPGRQIAFVGDGMNDAPVLSLSNVGIAMGGLGSDAAIESADVVIQTDNPSKIATAIKIGRTTHAIVIENIVGAIAIKAAVLALGALGLASLWAAVFADVGVALIAILNSMRIMWKKY